MISAGLALLFAASLLAAPPRAAPAKAPTARPSPVRAPAARPAPPLPSLPSVSRIRVEVARAHVVVVEDVLLPRGEWKGGDLSLYVSFGAPGAPLALDARLLSVLDGELEAREGERGEPVATERAPSRPVSAQLLLGRSRMAGVVVHVKEEAFRAASSAGAAQLRLRTLLPLPPEDAQTGRELKVRLGIPGGPPLSLGRIQVHSLERDPWLLRAEARLCGPDAEARPLSVSLTPRPAAPAPAPADAAPPVAPVLAVRHPSDDLCVRFWTSQAAPGGQKE